MPRAPKTPRNVRSIFYHTANFLPKDVAFEHVATNIFHGPGDIQPRFVSGCRYQSLVTSHLKALPMLKGFGATHIYLCLCPKLIFVSACSALN